VEKRKGWLGHEADDEEIPLSASEQEKSVHPEETVQNTGRELDCPQCFEIFRDPRVPSTQLHVKEVGG